MTYKGRVISCIVQKKSKPMNMSALQTSLLSMTPWVDVAALPSDALHQEKITSVADLDCTHS